MAYQPVELFAPGLWKRKRLFLSEAETFFHKLLPLPIDHDTNDFQNKTAGRNSRAYYLGRGHQTTVTFLSLLILIGIPLR